MRKKGSWGFQRLVAGGRWKRTKLKGERAGERFLREEITAAPLPCSLSLSLSLSSSRARETGRGKGGPVGAPSVPQQRLAYLWGGVESSLSQRRKKVFEVEVEKE